ncbi:ATP-binding protein [Phenylobacterium sp.]|uniref:ATP-binding protein n=1 Tax=Phenylobacterium sp. TaxID=1871053 RepID=UPI0027318AF4|nr:ATP-binding protein [Phenylobacterium sp.]MDP1874626.1 ATP-binding protein [Phenylobacterium sp.]
MHKIRMDARIATDSPTRESALDGRLARALAAVSHGMALIDLQGAITWVNDSFTSITGYTSEEAVGQNAADLLLGPAGQTEEAQITRRLHARYGHRAEASARRKSGETYWVDADLRPVSDSAGELESYVLTLADITEIRDAQRRSEAASTALRDAARMAGLGGWEINFGTAEIDYSPELGAMMGRTESSESLRTAIEVYLPEHRDAVMSAVIATVQNGERMDFEAEALTGDGRRIWLRVMGVAEVIDGVCVAVRGASQDITTMRRALGELRESEGFARGVIDGIAAMVAVIDANGQLIEANRSFRNAGGARSSPEQTPRLNMFEIFRRLPGGHGRSLERGIRAVIDGQRETFTRTYEAMSGEWFRLSASRFVGDGPVRVVIFTQSIADLKRSERRLRTLNTNLKRARDQADAANLAKSAFLATMSHEIRTPLNGVLGMAQAMAREDLPQNQKERLAVIRQAGETLLVLLNDLLDLSRIEAGRLELENGVVDIAQIAKGAQSTFTTLAAEKDLSFSLTIDPQTPAYWWGDSNRVRQILYNLVSNAVKFTARGSVEVKVTSRNGDLVMAVSDTGHGIAPERLGALFEKFVQADTSTTRKFGGSGLGLAICRELSSLMGGTISVQSVLERGSTFTVKLPLKVATAPMAEDALPDAVHGLHLAHQGPLRILAAEDNPMNQLVLKTLLAPLMIDLHLVDDGEDAVAAWADGQWDAILMDVQMPRMDGPTATRMIRIREEAEGRPRTPIIALTANAMSHHEREYLEAGMDALTPKPIELERLLGALDMLLAGAPSSSRA